MQYRETNGHTTVSRMSRSTAEHTQRLRRHEERSNTSWQNIRNILFTSPVISFQTKSQARSNTARHKCSTVDTKQHNTPSLI